MIDMKQPYRKQSRHSYLKIISIYLAICFCIIFVSMQSLKKLIEENNIAQMNTTIGLMAEKMNDSIQIMSGYVQEIAEILSARETMDLQQNYKELQNGIDNLPFCSIGLISEDGMVYGSPGEKTDMEKYRFPELAAGSEGVYITTPYRSSTTGNNVITMFYPFSHKGVRTGSVFVTYPLEEIQLLAHTDILEDDMDIFLMNAFSGNYIRCSDSDGMPSGSWNNVRLVKSRILSETGYDYDKWEQGMREGRQYDVTCMQLDGVSYIQAYENIDRMDGWYVVVRIPNSALSTVMQTYSRGTTVSGILLILATLTVLTVLLLLERSEKKELLQLSEVDPLTQTMNRRAFQKLLQEFFSDPDGKQAVLMFLDLDSFKHINDTYGHAAGDQLLHHFAASLQSIFRRDSVIARIGGDEFIVFIKNPPGHDTIDTMMQNLKQALEGIPLRDCEGGLTVRYSAGLAEYPTDAQDLEALKKAADKALYYVKRTSKDAYCWYAQIPAGTDSVQ